NFKIETDNYILYRFPRRMTAKLKEDGIKSDTEYKYLNNLKETLEKEENFNPTPKLLLEKDTKDIYIKENKGLELVEESIYQDSIINEALNTLKDTKIYYKDASLIIDELETLTVIDVNTSGIKSNQKKEVFFEDINRKIL